MGCDIHMYTERFVDWYGPKKWVNCDNWRINNFHEESDEGEYEHVDVYEGRDYHLFSILADVRNNHDNEPISEPKGTPFDISYHTHKAYKNWGSDAHSCSHFTMTELKKYLEDVRPVKVAGYISEKQSEQLDRGIFPDSWCQGTNISGYVHREWIDESNPVEYLIERLEKHMISVYGYYNEDKLHEYYDKFRIVFWFDN